MNKEKLSTEEIPQKFAEWLLAMGCPPEKVPSVDRIAQMCRGQYYMVWRSLMEHVLPKDVVRRKRLQVFYDDIRKCHKNNQFSQHEAPVELKLWRDHTWLQNQVADAESRVNQAQRDLQQNIDKMSTKMSQLNLARSRLEDSQRRSWLLKRLGEELRVKKKNLQETNAIADSLCSTDDSTNVQSKIDACISLLYRPPSNPASLVMAPLANPVACSSVIATQDINDTEEQVSSTVKSRGDVLWPQLYERRAALATALTAANSRQTDNTTTNRETPRSVVAHTAALHSSLALEAMKYSINVKQIRNSLADAVTELSEFLSSEERELFVVRCEQARARARVVALRTCLHEVEARAGAFWCSGGGRVGSNITKQLGVVDTAIATKKREIEKLVSSLATTERKIQSVKESLINVFNGFHENVISQQDGYTGVQLDLPQESVATLRQFYYERRGKSKEKMDLSLDLQVSDCSLNDVTDNNNPNFVDELKNYLKNFSLEKNRKLVLESGEKIWIFETLQSAVERLHAKWQTDNIMTSLVCPSVSLSNNLQRLIDRVQVKQNLEVFVCNLEGGERIHAVIDIKPAVEEKAQTIDKIKKQLHETIQSLQKTSKTIDIGRENLNFWSGNEIKKYISVYRTVNGITYKRYECEANY